MNIETIKAQQLQKLGADIHRLEGDMDKADLTAQNSLRTWAQIAIDLGHTLLAVRKAVGHGQFREWIDNNCTRKYVQCWTYAKMAEAWDAATDVQRAELLEKGSIRGFLEATKEESAEKTIAKHSPIDQRIHDSARKWISTYVAHTGEVSEPIREALRAEIQPVVASLWPNAVLA